MDVWVGLCRTAVGRVAAERIVVRCFGIMLWLWLLWLAVWVIRLLVVLSYSCMI